MKKMVSKVASIAAVAFALVFCALAQPTSRIVGGNYADYGQFPYQVAIYEYGDYNCGGSIISSRYVLTAAHCVLVNGQGTEIVSPTALALFVGSIYRLAGGKLLAVKNITKHEAYKGTGSEDIALLELEEELEFTEDIKKIDLFDGEVPNGAPVVISGWGRLFYGGGNPQRLKYNTLTKLAPSDCDTEIGYGIDSIICLAHTENNGACNGDSGGPATYHGKLVGVSSFSTNGCGSSKPDAFSKVSYHREWILEHMKY